MTMSVTKESDKVAEVSLVFVIKMLIKYSKRQNFLQYNFLLIYTLILSTVGLSIDFK